MNLQELEDRLKNTLEEDSHEFQVQLPDIMHDGELLIHKVLDLEVLDHTCTLTLSGTGDIATRRFLTRPREIIRVKSMFLVNEGVFLDPRSVSYCKFAYPNVSVTGVPAFYAIYDEDRFYIAPSPDRDFLIDVQCVQHKTLVSEWRGSGGNKSAYTNWLSQNEPDILFQACLAQAMQFLKKDVTDTLNYLNAMIEVTGNEVIGGERLTYHRLKGIRRE